MNFKAGDKVLVVGNTTGWNPSRVGEEHTIKSWTGSFYTLEAIPSGGLYAADLKPIEPKKVTRASVEAEIVDIKSKLKELELQKRYLDESEVDVIDAKEFKVYSTLTLIENTKMTKRQKSQAIAALLDD